MVDTTKGTLMVGGIKAREGQEEATRAQGADSSIRAVGITVEDPTTAVAAAAATRAAADRETKTICKVIGSIRIRAIRTMAANTSKTWVEADLKAPPK